MGELFFHNVTGQQRAAKHLSDTIRNGRILHAMILTGDEGAGKHELAEAFGAALLCEHPVEKDGVLEACGECHSCLQAKSDANPDLITLHNIDPKTGKEKPLSVDNIREMRKSVAILPYYANHKVYILPRADEMLAAAQNALLKTLEEPPEYAVILLLAKSTSTLLPTILSRCVTLRLQPVPAKIIEEDLTKRGVEPAKARHFAALAGGNPGRARRLAASESYGPFLQQVMDLYRDLPKKSAMDLSAFSQGLNSMDADFDAQEEFYLLSEVFVRDLAASLEGAPTLIFPQRITYSSNIVENASTVTFEQVERLRLAVEKARERRARNTDPAMTSELMLLAMRDALQNRK